MSIAEQRSQHATEQMLLADDQRFEMRLKPQEFFL
jgi:hypothetical protein